MEYAQKFETSYENFIATCPYAGCKKKNIFNRVTDLGRTDPISHMVVHCLHCGKEFGINSDLINDDYEVLFFDCTKLAKQKFYRYCVLNLCQSCEMLFKTIIEIKLAYEPYRNGLIPNVPLFNQLLKDLAVKIKDYGYTQLLNVALNILVIQTPSSVTEIKRLIDDFDVLKKGRPRKTVIHSMADSALSALLIQLIDLDINTFRNRVAHKVGYRPTKTEMEDSYVKVKAVIFPLKARLGIQHKLYYLNC